MIRSVHVGVIAITILLSSSNLFAQTPALSEWGLGTRSASMGGVATVSFSDALGCALNPAGSVNANKLTASVFYSSPQKDSDHLALGITLPTAHDGAFGFSYYHTGMEYDLASNTYLHSAPASMNNQHFMLNHARPLFRDLSLGINAEYSILDYGTLADASDFLGIDVGLQYQPKLANRIFRDVAVGIVLDNLVQLLGPDSGQPDAWGNDLDGSLRAYRFMTEKKMNLGHNRLSLVANLAVREEYVYKNGFNNEEKELSRIKLQLGFEYGYKSLVLRMGHREGTLTGGVGMNIGHIQLGYAYGSADNLNNDINSFSLSCEF